MNLEQVFNLYKEQSLHGRYITLESIEPALKKNSSNNELKIIGQSVLNNPIYKYEIGNGKNQNIALVTNARK